MRACTESPSSRLKPLAFPSRWRPSRTGRTATLDSKTNSMKIRHACGHREGIKKTKGALPKVPNARRIHRSRRENQSSSTEAAPCGSVCLASHQCSPTAAQHHTLPWTRGLESPGSATPRSRSSGRLPWTPQTTAAATHSSLPAPLSSGERRGVRCCFRRQPASFTVSASVSLSGAWASPAFMTLARRSLLRTAGPQSAQETPCIP